MSSEGSCPVGGCRPVLSLILSRGSAGVKEDWEGVG